MLWIYKLVLEALIFWKGKKSTKCIKGALDKYNISFYISNSIEDFKLNQYWNFQLISAKAFSFYEVFREQHHLQSVPQARPTVLYIYWSRLWKIENARNIHISSKVNQSKCKTQHAVITHANTSNGIKIPTFLEKVGDDVILVQCPFNLLHATVDYRQQITLLWLETTTTTKYHYFIFKLFLPYLDSAWKMHFNTSKPTTGPVVLEISHRFWERIAKFPFSTWNSSVKSIKGIFSFFFQNLIFFSIYL